MRRRRRASRCERIRPIVPLLSDALRSMVEQRVLMIGNCDGDSRDSSQWPVLHECLEDSAESLREEFDPLVEGLALHRNWYYSSRFVSKIYFLVCVEFFVVVGFSTNL